MTATIVCRLPRADRRCVVIPAQDPGGAVASPPASVSAPADAQAVPPGGLRAHRERMALRRAIASAHGVLGALQLVPGSDGAREDAEMLLKRLMGMGVQR